MQKLHANSYNPHPRMSTFIIRIRGSEEFDGDINILQALFVEHSINMTVIHFIDFNGNKNHYSLYFHKAIINYIYTKTIKSFQVFTIRINDDFTLTLKMLRLLLNFY